MVVEEAEVRQLARAGKLSLEMAARGLRHEFLARAARGRRIRSIALAHHADDQVELFFLRLLRGSGGEGLGGMKWRNPSPSDREVELVRPLLDQPKAVLLKYATECGIRYREDASNAMLDFQRNRIRHELLPLLRSKYQPALDRTLLRVMDIVGAEAEFAGRAAREWLRDGIRPKSKVQSPKSGVLSLKSKVQSPESEGRRGKGAVRAAGLQGRLAFDELPVAVQRRCVEVQLVRLGVAPDYELVEQLRLAAERSVAVGRSGAGVLRGAVPHYAFRDRSGLVHLQGAELDEFNSASTEVALAGSGGEVEFGGARIWWRIRSRGAVQRPAARAGRECFDADEVGSPVWLRHWQPGDRFQPIGMASRVKLQDMFTNQKVPRGRRREVIVAATADGEVFWVEGMRIAERFKLTNATIRCLQWRWKRA